MINKERRLMQVGMALVIVGAVVFLSAGFWGQADLGLAAGAVAWASSTVAVVYGAAEAAIKRLEGRVAELERPS